MEFKNVIVTGGAGFIGSHLVDALVPVSARVIVIDNKKPRKSWKNPDARYKLQDVKSGELDSVFKRLKPDVVFHLAAHIHDRESVHEPVMNAKENIIGSLNVFEAARMYAKKVVFASTGVIYGIQENLPIPIDAEPRPLTPYAISKLTSERYLKFYNSVYELPYVALRMGNVYGPRQDASAESGAIGIFASRFLRGEQVFINNDGLTTRDYVYVDDVVRAFLKAATGKFEGVVNVATGIETSTKQIYDLVSESVGVQTDADIHEETNDILKHVALDISETVKRIKWKPTTTLEEGIEKTVEWYRENI